MYALLIIITKKNICVEIFVKIIDYGLLIQGYNIIFKIYLAFFPVGRGTLLQVSPITAGPL